MKPNYFVTALLFILVGTATAQEINDTFAALKYRNIGPFRGGRASQIRRSRVSVGME